MILGLIALLVTSTCSVSQDKGALALPVQQGSSLNFALTNLQARGLRIDPGEVKLDRVRAKFDAQIRGDTLEDLLLFALGKCDPPLSYEVIEQGNDHLGPLVRLKYTDPTKTEASGHFYFQAADHIRIVLERIKTKYPGYQLDSTVVDKERALFGEQADGTNNILTKKYVGDTYEEFLANLFEDVRPTLRAIKIADKSYRVEIPFPLVGVQFGEPDPNAAQRGTSKPRKLDDILRELAEKSGFEIKNQTYAQNPVRVPENRSFGRRPLDEVLQVLAEGSSPKLEILDLDPDKKTCRVVIASAGGRPLVVPQPGHRGGIIAIERSPKGDRLITGGSEGTINLWNMTDSKTMRSFIGRVAENAFTLDGQTAIVARNNTIARYSYVRNRPEVIYGTGGQVVSLSFSPVKHWIWAGSADGTLYVVNERDPQDRKFFTDPQGTKHVSTSRDGKLTAVWVADSNVLAIWDTASSSVRDVAGNVLANIRVRGAIKAARFNAEGTRLAVWHAPGAVSLFDQSGSPVRVSNGQYPNELVSYDDPDNPQATPFSFSPSGRTIAVATGNDQLGFFNAADGRSVGQPLNRQSDPGAGSWVFSAVSWLKATPESDGDEVAVGLDTTEIARDKDKLAVYSVSGGQRLRLLEGNTLAVDGITFSRDGRVLIARDRDGFRRWDITMRIPPSYTPASVVGVQTSNWLNRNESNNGVFIVGVSNETPGLDERVPKAGAARVTKRPHAKRWFFGDTEASQTYKLDWINPAGVNSIIFSGDGQRVGWVANNHIFLGEVGELTPRKLEIPDSPIIAARLSGTGQYLVTVSGQARGVIRIWDLQPFYDGKDAVLWKTMQDGPRNLVDERSIAVSRQHNVIAMNSGTETIVLSLVSKEVGGSRSIAGRHPALSDDGHYLAVEDGGRCKVFRIFRDGNFLDLVPMHTSPNGRFMPVLSPSGGQLVTFSTDRLEAYYQNWSVSKGSEAKWDRHRAPINDVAFSSEGGMVATASEDGTIWLYGMKSEEIRVKPTDAPLGKADRGGHALVQLRGLDEDNFVVTDVYNQYWASKEASRLINFSAGGQTFSYAQFDLLLNRPHEIMGTVDYASAGKFALKADMELVESAVRKRLRTGSEDPLAPIDENFRFEAPTTPLVEVQGDPKTGEVNLKVGLADPRVPIVKWNVTVNNVPEQLINGGTIRTDPQAGAVFINHRVKLLPGENTVRVWSVNERTASSLAYELRLTNPTPVAAPNLVVFAVGISNYLAAERLPAAGPDASRFVESFRRFDRTQKDAYANSPFAKVTLVPLIDKTKDEIMASAKQHLTGLRPQDQVIILLAGHGQTDEENEFQFLTKNYAKIDGFKQAISYREIQQILRGCGSRQMLVLIDACKAGALPTYTIPVPGANVEQKTDATLAYRRSTAPAMNADALAAVGLSYSFAYMKAAFIDLENESGATVIAAVTGGSYAYELDAGFFTKAVREAFNKDSGADENKDGKLSVQELKAYVIERVPRLDGNKVPQMRQRPSVRQENLESDFAVFTYPMAAAPAKKPQAKKPPAKKPPAKKPPVKTTKKGGG